MPIELSSPGLTNRLTNYPRHKWRKNVSQNREEFDHQPFKPALLILIKTFNGFTKASGVFVSLHLTVSSCANGRDKRTGNYLRIPPLIRYGCHLLIGRW